MTKVTDYIGNKIYEQGTLKKILIDGGYIEDGKYYFTQQDHLGNTRMVLSQEGSIVQREYYYPFGMTVPHIEYDGKHPYRYNGKELDQMHRLDLYDYSARYYDQAIGRFTTVDPLAELHYDNSPYNYVLNNPLKYIDINGMDTTYVNPHGETIVHLPGGDNVQFPTANDVIIESDQSEGNTSYSSFFYTLGIGGTLSSAYASSFYSPDRPFSKGYFYTSRGNRYNLSVLEPNASGKYANGIQGIRYGHLYAKKSARIPAKIGAGLSYISLAYSSYSFVSNPSIGSGFDVAIGVTGIIYWEAAVPYVYFNAVGKPNIEQIKHNIGTGQHPLNNTVNPTTGEYYVPGYFSGFGF